MVFRRKNYYSCFSAFFLCCFSFVAVSGVIVAPDEFALQQPNGYSFKVKAKGNIKHNWVETLAGKRIKKVGDSWFYLKLDSNNRPYVSLSKVGALSLKEIELLPDTQVFSRPFDELPDPIQPKLKATVLPSGLVIFSNKDTDMDDDLSLDPKQTSFTQIAQLSFNDANLARCVSSHAAINTWSQISEVTELNCATAYIKDLSGLSYFTHLTSLTLINNKIKDLTDLQTLVELTYLDLRKNDISDISDLNNLTKLVTLKLSKNQVTQINTISKLIKLRFLSISENNVNESMLNTLLPLTELNTLYLRNNQFTSISALGKMQQLKKLYLSNNQLSDISPLAPLTGLLTLKLENNMISDVSALFELGKVNSINLRGNDTISCADLDRIAQQGRGRVLTRPDVCLN